MRLVALALLIILSTGCARLPAVSAKSLRYESAYPIGGTSIQASDVEVTQAQVKIGAYRRTTKIWGFTQSVEIGDYARDRAPAETAAISTP